MPRPAANRRDFVSLMASLGGYALLKGTLVRALDLSAGITSTTPNSASPKALIRYPQKAELILLTDRPPQLETPLHYFRTDLTPNDAFYVRWHLSGIPTTVDLRTFRLEVTGNVHHPLSFTLSDLRSKFEPVSLVALSQCSGNSRSFFDPRVPGGQWGNGAMGNGRWKGTRLKDILDTADVQAGTVEVGFRGLDQPALAATPPFEKSLHIDHARDGEVMVAYEMNGAPLPMLNGFPLRLVVPGWYATYWVKSLSSITVLDQPLKSFWMDKAYRIPDSSNANEDPQHLAAATTPINRMAVHSIFVWPEAKAQLARGKSYQLVGVATNGGSGIRRVEVSMDGGQTWTDTALNDDLGKYSWRRWHAEWTPPAQGDYRLMVRATSGDGEKQVASMWNRSGYARNVIEHVDVTVL